MSFLLAITRVIFVLFLVRVTLGALRTPRNEREVSLAVSGSFIAGDSLATVALVANALVFGVVWPYLAAIIWILTEAAVSFTRLVMVSIRRE